jgi:D-ribose pyranose/furanose isomerase RbsD
MNNKVNVSTYKDLVSVIRKEIEVCKVILERDANERKTTVMWHISSHIHTHILEHLDKADYGNYNCRYPGKIIVASHFTLD